MPHNIRYLSASLMALALFSACGERAEGSGGDVQTDVQNAPDQAAANDPAATPADGNPNQEMTPGVPDLIPPAPGELGGLPDDRRPLDESPIDPASIRGAGSALEKYAIALERKDFDAAYALWSSGGEHGLTKAKLAEIYEKYLTIHVLIGRPEAAGTGSDKEQTARVPVQIYGRLKDSNNEPYNLIGTITMVRTDEAAMPWAIIDSALEPRGVVREDKSDTAESSVKDIKGIIPSDFQGKWAARANQCNSDTSEMNLHIGPETLDFWESQATVKSAEQDGQRLTITADYTGEGETWTRTTSYTLSLDGETLTSDDGTSRVRCK